jgi:type IV pilus assembly protein PilV
MTAKRFPSTRTRARPQQRGFMLIEALIAILIFSVGILGMVGLQAAAVNQSTDARYRSEAAYLADQLLSQMWVGDRTVAALQAKYASCGSSCTGWYAWYQRVQGVLPGVSDSGDTRPIVTVDTDGRVKIKVFWRMPSEDPATPPHLYGFESQIAQ